MEHQDNSFLNNYLQNSQNLMENLQIPSGVVCGDGGIVGSDEISGIGGNIGGKLEEHEHNEEEWKYMQEVQQSEKQQTIKLDGKEGVGYGVGDDMLLGQHEYEIGNGNGNGNGNIHVGVDVDGNIDVNVDDVVGFNKSAILDEEEVEIIKNDGDFSTTSNTTSTAGEDVDGTDILQAEIKMDAHHLQHQNEQFENIIPQFGEHAIGRGDEFEEEEPSSLATNTTNGTSSLSENSPKQTLQQDFLKEDLQFEVEVDNFSKVDDAFENKENSEPLRIDTSITTPTDSNKPLVHSPMQLNPDAKEFVPRFGSNPGSPIPVDLVFDTDAVPRHLLQDDFVAESPRKGRGSNMDYISLPGENEFKVEAAQRPHELEQEDDLIANLSLEETMQVEDSVLDNVLEMNAAAETQDCLDYQEQSPNNFIDHGPETCVDMDTDIDPMKQSIYMQNNDSSIENILNTVQPLPSDNDNDCYTDDLELQIAGEKELLNIEEKENISNSPSTEEMQMNLRNELHSSIRDVPQLPIDMDNAALMQESLYMEHTSTDNQQEQPIEDIRTGESMIFDTTNPLCENDSLFNASADTNYIDSMINNEDTAVVATPETLEFVAASLETTSAVDDALLSPQSTEEKHIIEDIKEQLEIRKDDFASGLDELEQKFDNLQFGNDVNLKQDIEPIITDINNDIADFIQESETQFEEHNVELHQQHEVLQNEQINNFVEKQDNEHLMQSTELESPIDELKEFERTYDDKADINLISEYETKLATDFEIGHNENFDGESLIAAVTEPIVEAVTVPEVSAAFEEPMQEITPISVTAEQEIVVEQQTELTPVVEPVAFAEVAIPVEEPIPVQPAVESAVENTQIEPIVATGAAVVGAVAAVATTAAVTIKKADAAKKPTTAAAAKTTAANKTKSVPNKKPVEAKKTTTTVAAKTSTITAARPRTAPVKPSSTLADKKPTTTATNKTATTTITKKSVSTTNTAAKLAPKTTSLTARPATAPAANATKTTATTRTVTSRPATATTTTVRKTTSNITATATTGTSKPRLSLGSATATKPTTLGLNTAAKPKLPSPRSTLSSQLRNSATAAAKSPVKPTANGLAAKTTTTAAATRTKSTTTTATTTRTFTARPAPKTTASTITTTTTRRTTTGGVPNATTTKTTTTTTTLRKSTPSKTTSTATVGKVNSPLKLKTKDANKTTTPSKPIALKAKKPDVEGNVNGADAGAGAGTEETIKLNGDNLNVFTLNGQQQEVDENQTQKIAPEMLEA